MSDARPYLPSDVFVPEGGVIPRVLIAPARYVQGDGVLDHLGRYVAPIGASHAAVLISAGGRRRFGERVSDGLRAAGVRPVLVEFGGESSVAEIDRVAALLRGSEEPIDLVLAVGGGKCIDAGKAVAYRLGLPAAICPTLASTDAPCSALSVIYSSEGVVEAIEFFPDSPALVAVDTRVAAEAPPRYLVSGMGDALATWYEARTCLDNPEGRSTLGARPTIAVGALGRLCAETLFDYGVDAAAAAERREVNDALERVVEANTLLSGVGFESGGIAAAHCVASGLTAVQRVRENYMHGEMVAMGLLTQLVLEDAADEARRVAEFCVRVGLPVHLGQVSLSPSDRADLMTIMGAATAIPFVANEPFPVTADSLLEAALAADRLGRDVAASQGDAPYRKLQAAAA